MLSRIELLALCILSSSYAFVTTEEEELSFIWDIPDLTTEEDYELRSSVLNAGLQAFQLFMDKRKKNIDKQ
jgi:hypothetical protein